MAKTILIADDEQQSMMVILKYLQALGDDNSLIGAPNGELACKLALEKSPDIILLDWYMPDMTGIEVLEFLKSQEATKDIPIVMVTALTGSSDLEYALQKGAIDYIRKPVDRIELIARVKSALQLHDYLKEIKRQQTELSQLNHVKDKVFSIIAHDLRNPFASIGMFVDVLLENAASFTPEEVADIANDLHESLSSANLLLENLLEWSRSQMEHIDMLPQKLQPEEVANSVARLFRNNIQNKGVKLTINFSADCVVFADAHMINFIIRNLVSNAIKFTPTDGEIYVEGKVLGEEMCEILVKDTGVGISEENLARLFNEDDHVSTRGTEGEKGTGLGLMLCKEFVEKNGGSIQVESKVGEGSVFRFTLPAYIGQESIVS
ncbi:MAG: hybrid sensor histidine kinase/response regulator [Flammeovirgaceae bacterium]